MKFLIALALFTMLVEGNTSPNIILIVADDLGWDDVSFHGSNQFFTPNIDLLAYTGVALGSYYSHCVCTPSRSALLTGNYGHTLGMQGYPLTNAEDRGLPLSKKILPQYLKERGYATHLVGKWHLGHSRTEYLPTMRGFDTHFGHRGGFIDYYEYVLEESWDSGRVSGFDLYRNMSAQWKIEGYLTDIYNEEAKLVIKNHDISRPLFLMLAHNAPHSGNEGAPLQAPPEAVRAMRHVDLPERRIFAAMTKKLDDSIGDVMKTLYEKGILENSVIVFVSDNGGMTTGDSQNFASNWPLRGIKMSPFEGGIRVGGLLWSPLFNNSHHLWNGRMHVADWVPTLLSAAGFEPPADIDGKDQWESITQNKQSERDEIFEINDYTDFAAVISRDYKLVTGNILSNYGDYHGADMRNIIGNGASYENTIKKCDVYTVLKNIGHSFNFSSINIRDEIKVNCNNDVRELCRPKIGKHCLFYLKDDPCESKDISLEQPDIVGRLESLLEAEMKRMIPRMVPLFRDPRGRPSLHNYTWASSWADNLPLTNLELK